MPSTDVSSGAHSLTLLATPRYFLCEGPAWDGARATVSWVDIEEGLVVSAPYQDGVLGELTTIEVGGVVGCAIPLGDGRFLVSLESWIGILHPSGRLEKSRALIPANRRFNDGKIDPQGRLVVGSLRRANTDDTQHLIRLEHDGTVTVLDADLHQSNGLGWSADGSVFYNADTSVGIIFRRSYIDGVAGGREVFVDMDGIPDGLTVDTDGNVWVTVFDGERVDCYAPDGTRLVERTIHLPGRHPSSVEFVGPGLDDLIVTTGFPRMEDPAAMALKTHHDGELYVTRPGARGVATTPWHEIPLPPRSL
ncbi:MAG: SMP-30/gluconolactonase/LRE family protein [Mycetocola sp.]